MVKRQIILKKVRVNNLKDIDLTLDHGQFIVITGPSGSGKSSLAFDTIYAEGRRRFIDSLSHSAKRFLKELPKPDAEKILGLSPTIAVEQKILAQNPRSTVGTITSIYDYLRVLFAKLAIPYCPIADEPIRPQSREKIFKEVQSQNGVKAAILAPFAKKKKSSFSEEFKNLLKEGFSKVRVDGAITDISEIGALDEKKAHDVDLVIDRLEICPENRTRLLEALAAALERGKGILTVLNLEAKEEKLFSEHAYSPKSGRFYPALTPSDFSFNHPAGMCERCQGLGEVYEFDFKKIIDPKLSIPEGCCKIASPYQTVKYGNIYDNLARIYKFDINAPWEKLPQKARDVFLHGCEQKWTLMHFFHPRKKKRWKMFIEWRGVLNEAYSRLEEASSEEYKEKVRELMLRSVCSSCSGSRLMPYPSHARLGGKKIHQVTALTIEEAISFVSSLQFSKSESKIAEGLILEICRQLNFLNDIGLHYLALDRSAPSLSGGESQRVKIASQLGCGLNGTTYVLDEPSIGLHPNDHAKLLKSLFALRDKKNTIIVIEHDRETIECADTIVDVGPLAGRFGGQIVACGDIEKIKSCPESLTGKYLSGKLKIEIPKKRRSSFSGFLNIKKAGHNNLKDIDVSIPLNGFICVTGVSGSGKSSLISDLLYPALHNALNKSSLFVGKHEKIEGLDKVKRVIFIDQAPIGRTPRSNPATYIKMFDEVRDLFAMTPLAQAKGFGPGIFSFNVKEGSCPYCHGLGEVKVDLDFLEDAYVTCGQCKGKRFDEEVLSVKFKGKNILDILNMEIEELKVLFENFPKISSKLQLMEKVGLDYIHLGQPSTTLSGGEAQRIKLAKELSKPSHENTIYILDEPTTGLHFAEIEKLLKVLHELVEKGSTVLVIEHNMDFVKAADWIIDLGPKGGKEGGYIVGEGSPEKIAKLLTPTGRALKKALTADHSAKTIRPERVKNENQIIVEGARENNLKNLSVKIPHGAITLFTGPSGSGKTTLAFDTIYSEAQRRYIETLPPYLRSFLKQDPKPKVEKIEGLLPSISIEQKGHSVNPRSTVGTITEIYDLLRVVFAHLGIAYCPETKEKITEISKEYVKEKLMGRPGQKVQILSPVELFKKESFEEFLQRQNREGFLKIRLNKSYYEIDEKIPFDPRVKNEICVVIDRLVIKGGVESRLLEALELASRLSSGKIIADFEKEELFFNLSFAAEKSLISYPPLTFQTFSFNSEQGYCPHCQGLGFIYGANLTSEKNFINKTPLSIFSMLLKRKKSSAALNLLKSALFPYGIDLDQPLASLSKEQLDIFLYGEKRKSPFTFKGLLEPLEKMAKSGRLLFKKPLLHLMQERLCPECGGARLNPLARNVRLNGLTITDLCSLSIDRALEFFEKLKCEKHFLQESLLQIKLHLGFLKAIGLGYISLGRSAPTLSGGELQRIRLAKQLASGLISCLYVLDEPTIGLHPHNNALLIKALKELKNLGNTLIIVEHDPAIIREADYIFDFGPKGGSCGGEIVAQGSLDEILKNERSLTGLYLSGRRKIAAPAKRRLPKGFIEIKKGRLHNLKDISISIPLGTLTAVSGVSGSGKSTLIRHLLKEGVEKGLKENLSKVILPFGEIHGIDRIDRLISLDQSFSTQTARSDLSTYSDIMPILRQFFSSLKLAQAKGLKPSHFSSNHKKGMCKNCLGLGYRSIDLQYLPSVRVECEECQGHKLNQLALSVKYKDTHLGQIQKMTVEEAKEFFSAIPKVVKKLDLLISIGTGYLRLGQEIASLSGGELQRVKLGRELAKRTSDKTLYIFDEPTIGLHFGDIEKLIAIFHELADKGNSIVVIEHNQELIANCDYVIDIGPGAGAAGGEIVACGTPEEIIAQARSVTGKYLKELL